jgi:hypothetical protein
MDFKPRTHAAMRGEVLLVSVTGLLRGMPGIAKVRSQLIQEINDHPAARAVVVDLLKAIPALALSDWVAFKESGPSVPIRPTLPIALVVSPDFIEFGCEYGDAMAKRGLRRFFFISLDAAFAWASERMEPLRPPVYALRWTPPSLPIQLAHGAQRAPQRPRQPQT